ncbi:MAG: hypothetical protein WBB62_18445 [Rhodococcus sp. (in: high G+C Gram-positive bacteria)]
MLGADLCAVPLGQVQVVASELVLRAVRAAEQALAAQLAARTFRSLAAEERVRLGDTRRTEVDRDRDGSEGVLGADRAGRLVKVVVHRAGVAVGDPAEHAGRPLKVRSELGLPVVGEMRPRRVAVERLAGLE